MDCWAHVDVILLVSSGQARVSGAERCRSLGMTCQATSVRSSYATGARAEVVAMGMWQMSPYATDARPLRTRASSYVTEAEVARAVRTCLSSYATDAKANAEAAMVLTVLAVG